MSDRVMSREERDELALVLFSRMLSRRPVWVDSPANQMVWIQLIGLDEQGEVIAYDHDGNDRRADEYLLDPRTEGANHGNRDKARPVGGRRAVPHDGREGGGPSQDGEVQRDSARMDGDSPSPLAAVEIPDLLAALEESLAVAKSKRAATHNAEERAHGDTAGGGDGT